MSMIVMDNPRPGGARLDKPVTFDAEVGPALIGEVFGDVEVEAWDGPSLRLPDQAALRRYLIGRAQILVPQQLVLSSRASR